MHFELVSDSEVNLNKTKKCTCMYVHFTLLHACGLVQVCTTRFDLALSPMNSYGTGLHVILLVWMNWVTVSTWTG